MSGYVHYTDDQIARANNTDIPAMLQSIGHTVKKEGANWRWVSGHDSLMIKGCEWFHNSNQSGGGGAINFCKQYLDMDFKGAMAFLLHGEQGQGFQMAAKKEPEPEHRDFTLPNANPNMKRVFAYLTKERCLDPDIVSHFAHAKKIYEDAAHHNAVFVGHDEKGAARFACARGTVSFAATSFRRDVAGSDKRFGFNHAGTSGKLLCFEAPIDMLSYISLHKQNWQADSYIALGGVSDKALLHFLEQHQNINAVRLCLDHDPAGLEAIQRIGAKVQGMGYEVSAYISHFKDWNAQLQELRRPETQIQTTAPESVEVPALTMKGGAI